MPPRPLPQVKRIANAAPLHTPMGMQMQPMPRQGQVLKSQSLHSLRPGTQLNLFSRTIGAR